MLQPASNTENTPEPQAQPDWIDQYYEAEPKPAPHHVAQTEVEELFAYYDA